MFCFVGFVFWIGFDFDFDFMRKLSLIRKTRILTDSNNSIFSHSCTIQCTASRSRYSEYTYQTIPLQFKDSMLVMSPEDEEELISEFPRCKRSKEFIRSVL